MLTRRQFVLALSGTLPAALLASARGEANAPVAWLLDRPVQWLATCRRIDGGYAAAGIDATGALCFETPLPGRGHGFAMHPSRAIAYAIARRPGAWLIGIDLHNGERIIEVRAGAGRHFYGHAAVSTDGRWLYTTENRFDDGAGVIGVRDVDAGLRQVAELPAHGIGPHELLLDHTSARPTLVVAVGGIRTHPDTGRAKLNQAGMRPALSYIDAETGSLLERAAPPMERHQLSIRHLAQAADGTICVGLQFEGPVNRIMPIAALHRRGEPLKFLDAPPSLAAGLRNYCGSVAADRAGNCFATSAPRGNQVLLWERDGRFAGSIGLSDGCGVAASHAPGAFLLTGGGGELLSVDETAMAMPLPVPSADIRSWDNHCVQALTSRTG